MRNRPVIKPTKSNNALVRQDERMLKLMPTTISNLYRVDWRALERNKYAPWGRGHASRLPQ